MRLHATRLMPVGEVALWRGGVIVWSGLVGARIAVEAFDAISMNVADADVMRMRAGKLSVEAVLQAVADWWG